MKIYRNEKAPTMKDGCIWIHRSKYKDTSSPLIAEVWSGNGWEELQSEEITEDIKEILGDINVLSSELVGHGQAIDALELKIDDLVEITYSDLKALRDAGNLVPGRQYRITDYDCTTVQEDTRSAMKPFDIIVVADSNDKLNENARAVQSARDTDGYFSNSNLAAWQLKYCLDNDTDRFAWADVENGKGVIYRMIDEFNNDCPYDFKNIQYKRYKIIASEKCPSLVGKYGISGVSSYSVDIEDFIYAFTFTWIKEDNEIEDGSFNEYAYDNIILSYVYYGRYRLNNNVLINTDEWDGPELYDNTFGNDCFNNTFGNNCYNNTFGNYCSNNTFGYQFHHNTLGNECSNNTAGGESSYRNTFGDGCSNNTFGDIYNHNNFGYECSNNAFGYECSYNTFGNNCENNTFGNNCENNTFGNGCSSNTFGNDCFNNTFGDFYLDNNFGYECSNNTFGNICSNNFFGNRCSSNTFGNRCSSNTFGESKNNLKEYYFHNHLSDGVQCCNINNTETGSLYNLVQFYEVKGVQGTSSNYVQISVTRNNQYTTTVQKNTSGEIKQFCLADLVE